MDVQKREPLCTVSGNVTCYSHCGKQYGGSSKKLKVELLYDSAILLLDKQPKNMKTGYQRDMCTPNFFKKINFIGVQLIYNVVLVSGVQQSNSLIHIHIFILFKILFSCRLSQNTEQSFLCSTVGHYQLSILYIVLCICQSQSPSLSLPFPPLVTI